MLLHIFEAQLRARVPDPLPPRTEVSWDGPLLRIDDPTTGGWVLYRDLAGADVDALISGAVAWFGERGRRFEWKHYGHDLPVDLPDRLRAAGFVPEEQETVVAATVERIAGPVVLPAGITLREVTERADFERVAAMEEAVWGDRSHVAGMLEEEHLAGPDAITVVVAEAADEVVCAAWIRFERGTEFGTLWGGATLPEWRRKGIYRATVAHRANLARDRGFRYLSVDASEDSRPILERLGFVALTTTTPFLWSP